MNENLDPIRYLDPMDNPDSPCNNPDVLTEVLVDLPKGDGVISYNPFRHPIAYRDHIRNSQRPDNLRLLTPSQRVGAKAKADMSLSRALDACQDCPLLGECLKYPVSVGENPFDSRVGYANGIRGGVLTSKIRKTAKELSPFYRTNRGFDYRRVSEAVLATFRYG